ncbi:MAG: ABC-type transport auxiliary lipoprotein family protein [Myxococcales bacterium]|nr:ABC-type transport auxiliary lipoprotein family protein [Myxococcales bacterium]
MNRTPPMVMMGLLMAFSGCALLSKGEVGTRRFYTLDQHAPVARAKGEALGAELRLGRVTAGACGSELMMVRQSPFEVSFDEERRWTQRPEVSLRRALSRVLFEELGLRSVLGGAGPVLDVELLEFEEVRGPSPVGRVTVTWSLSDDRVVSTQRTLRVERPIVKSAVEGEAVAEAIGAAMREAVETMAREVVSELLRR